MRFLAALLLPAFASAAMFPDALGTARRLSIAAAPVTDRSLWEEYGLQASELAVYEADPAPYKLAGYRLQDSTGALAAYQWQRSMKAATGTVARVGNYVLIFDGHRPNPAELGSLKGSLPRLEEGPLPTLPNYLPSNNLAPVSERYVIGPTGLARFLPGVSPATAGFHLGAEAQLGEFTSPAGNLKLAIFSYPTVGIARDRQAEFQKVSTTMVKRAGPLVAIIQSPPDLNEAEKLLSQIHYQAAITQGHRFPTPKDNVGAFMVNLFELIGILLVFCALSGLAVGGFRMILRRGGPDGEGGQMISLGLRNR